MNLLIYLIYLILPPPFGIIHPFLSAKALLRPLVRIEPADPK